MTSEREMAETWARSLTNERLAADLWKFSDNVRFFSETERRVVQPETATCLNAQGNEHDVRGRLDRSGQRL